MEAGFWPILRRTIMSRHASKERSWFPNTSLSTFKHEVNDLIENFLGDSLPNFRGDLFPRIDLAETADALEISAEVPGFKPEEISIDIGDNYLTLSGQHSESCEDGNAEKKFHRVERRMNSFSRAIFLPASIDEEKIEANLSGGILNIRLPKREESRRRRVPVKGAEQSSSG
jgi:HSP20 family protein